MMSHRIRASRALAAALLLVVAQAVGAAAAIQPLPEPDLTRLPEDTRKMLVETRRQFDEARPSLVGLHLAEAYAQLGAINARYGEWTVARTALGNAMAILPEDGRFPYLLAVFTEQAGEKPRARDLYRAALALDDQYLPIRYRLAALLIDLGDLAGARATVAEVARQRQDLAPPAALLGEVSLREKRWAEADGWFAQALKADPGAIALHARRAEALAGLGRRAEADAERAKAGPVTPRYADPLVDGIFAPPPVLPSDQALALAAEGKHAEATALLDAVLKQLPDNPELLGAYARVEADRGNLAAATARADAALKAAPDSAEALLARGMVDEMAGRADDARRRYEAAVRADLESATARLALGNDAMRRKQYAQAAEQYRQLAVLEAGSGTGAGRLAAALALAGRCAEAIKETNATLAQRPRDGGAMQAFVRLAATCPAATAEERTMAADYGQALYRQRPDEAHAEALAMAMAAVGRKDEAVDYQAQAIFEAVKRQDAPAIERLKAGLARFQAGQAATQPWPAGHPFIDPPALAPSARAPAR